MKLSLKDIWWYLPSFKISIRTYCLSTEITSFNTYPPLTTTVFGVKKHKMSQKESSIPKTGIAPTFADALSERDGWERLPHILTNFEKQCASCYLSKQACSRNCMLHKVLPRVRQQLKFVPYTCFLFVFFQVAIWDVSVGLLIPWALRLPCFYPIMKHFSTTPPSLREEEENIGALAAWLCTIETGNRTTNVTRVALLAVCLGYFR